MNKKKNPSVGAFAEINLQSATGLSEYVEQSSKNTWKYIRHQKFFVPLQRN